MDKKLNKVGILTINSYDNYGNRFQNYALEKTVKNLGFEVETILVNRCSQDTMIQRFGKISSFREMIQKVLNRIRRKLYWKAIRNRKDKFIVFSNKHINETNFQLSVNEMPQDLGERCDFFIAGSDQIWNPYNLHGTTYFFLTFACHAKRIAYAPSFGLSRIPDEFTSNYKTWLLDMNFISVREDEGARIIKELTGIDVPVLMDPSLLLSKEEWLEISEPANKPAKKYLLTYFLGSVSRLNREKIKNIAIENNLSCIHLADIAHSMHYATGPGEFIDYISDSSLICTDSFHGTVFAILFEKPFIVYERQGGVSMFSRINTLLKKFDLSSRKAGNILCNEDVFRINFSHVPSLLDAERKKAIDFLMNALGKVK